ncbi:hypothetical protein Sjap_017192 [Stephania japonica]|uniref:Uncharacterized protein n=1 Tax=Stephania japonica TaxID=461633 RepID=A0AAP0NI15_9MAGN
MESKAEQLHLQTNRESRDSYSQELDKTLTELANINEEIRRARDIAMQSWLDSKPLTDCLENRQQDLEKAKSRAAMVAVKMSELESQLETANASISNKKGEEVKARNMIEELQKSLDQKHVEMEMLKFETDHNRRQRGKMKQQLRLRKQTLRTLQLTLRAVRIESEALGASAAAALQHTKLSDSEQENNVQLSLDKYSALTRRDDEELALAEWRVSMSNKQREMAESRRDDAVKRLKQAYDQRKSRKMAIEADDMIDNKELKLKRAANKDDHITRNSAQVQKSRKRAPDMTENQVQEHKRDDNNENHATRKRVQSIKTKTAPQEANVESVRNQGYVQKIPKRMTVNHSRKMTKKKKSSIFYQIKRFFARNITRFFR